MLELRGHVVERVNHVGDWGTQFGMLIEYLHSKFPNYKDNLPDISDLNAFYRQAKAAFDADEEFKRRSREMVVKLQGGDAAALESWRLICDISRKEFAKVYSRLGVHLEERGESAYNATIPDVVRELTEKNLVKESDGAKCVFTSAGEVPLLLVKSDGGYGYDTTDLAAIRDRLVERSSDWLIYVTDLGQEEHFMKVFAAAAAAGWQQPPRTRLDHVGFGVVQGQDGKRFKTRSGETVKLVDLLDEATARALKELLRRKAEENAAAAVEEEEEGAGQQAGSEEEEGKTVKGGEESKAKKGKGKEENEETQEKETGGAASHAFLRERGENAATASAAKKGGVGAEEAASRNQAAAATATASRRRGEDEEKRKTKFLTSSMTAEGEIQTVASPAVSAEKGISAAAGKTSAPAAAAAAAAASTGSSTTPQNSSKREDGEEQQQNATQFITSCVQNGVNSRGSATPVAKMEVTEEMRRAAEAIGYSAVKYFDLKQNRHTDYKFSYDRMLDPKGESSNNAWTFFRGLYHEHQQQQQQS